LITGLFLLLLVGLGAPNARADFDFEFLGEFGHKMSVVIDKGGHYHISHIRYESRSSWLKYSTNASGSWITERLAYASGSRMIASAIALDRHGVVHIAYIGSGDLMHLTNATGDWVATPIVKGIEEYTNPGLSQLILDDKDCLHLSYNDWDEIGYATSCGDPWRSFAVPETLDAYAGYNEHALALDAHNRPHISYNGKGGLRHATLEAVEFGRPPFNLTTSRWSHELVDARNGLGANDIAIDGNGRVHISYYGENRPDAPWATSLNYAVQGDLGWIIEADIGADGDVVPDDFEWYYPGRRQNVMTLDRNGKVHIVYGLGILIDGDLEYDIEYITNRSGEWSHPEEDAIYWYHDPAEFRDVDIIADGQCGIHIFFNVEGTRMTALAYDPNGCPFPGIAPSLKLSPGVLGPRPIP
jgi:hypothetical protein